MTWTRGTIPATSAAMIGPVPVMMPAAATPTPPIAVVTARLDLELSSPVIDMAPPSARTIVITTARAPADRRAALQGDLDEKAAEAEIMRAAGHPSNVFVACAGMSGITQLATNARRVVVAAPPASPDFRYRSVMRPRKTVAVGRRVVW